MAQAVQRCKAIGKPVGTIGDEPGVGGAVPRRRLRLRGDRLRPRPAHAGRTLGDCGAAHARRRPRALGVLRDQGLLSGARPGSFGPVPRYHWAHDRARLHRPRFELHAGALRLALRPDLGGCIAGLWHRDTPMLRSTEPAALTHARDAGSYPLVPYSNRLGYRRFRWKGHDHTTQPNFDDNPHSVHGVGWQRPWEMVSSQRRRGGAALPPRGRCRLAVRLRGDAVLRRSTPQSLHVRAGRHQPADIAQPVGLGWHPYFPKRARSRLHIELSDRWDNDADPAAGAQGRAAGHRQRRRRTWTSTTASTAGAARRASATRSFSLQLTSSLDRPGRLHAAGQGLLLRRAGQPRQQRDPHGRPARARPAQRRAGREHRAPGCRLDVGGALMERREADRRPCASRSRRASLLGESPLWHPARAGAVLVRHSRPPPEPLRARAAARSRTGTFDTEPGELRAAARRRPAAGDARRPVALRPRQRRSAAALAAPPYDPTQERFNDGKCDPQGRFWVGTIYEPRDAAAAALHCWRRRQADRSAPTA